MGNAGCAGVPPLIISHLRMSKATDDDAHGFCRGCMEGFLLVEIPAGLISCYVTYNYFEINFDATLTPSPTPGPTWSPTAASPPWYAVADSPGPLGPGTGDSYVNFMPSEGRHFACWLAAPPLSLRADARVVRDACTFVDMQQCFTSTKPFTMDDVRRLALLDMPRMRPTQRQALTHNFVSYAPSTKRALFINVKTLQYKRVAKVVDKNYDVDAVHTRLSVTKVDDDVEAIYVDDVDTVHLSCETKDLGWIM